MKFVFFFGIIIIILARCQCDYLDDDDDREDRQVLDAHEEAGEARDERARRRRPRRQLRPPVGHLLGTLQPEREVLELRIAVRAERVGVVRIVFLEPHGGGDAEDDARIELPEQISRERDAAGRDDAVVHRVMADECGLLQREP